jgi:pyruvate formate lyase activating enzyme
VLKGIISGIKRMEIHDGDGIRTTVFFKGCPLRCLWCHNPESLSYKIEIAKFEKKCIGCGMCKGVRSIEGAAGCPTDALVTYGEEYDVDTLVSLLEKDRSFFENSGGGVTLSGGECLTQPDFAVALAKALHDRGISVFVDTCGYVKREVLEKIMPYTDVFLYDIKAVTAEVHERCTGKDNKIILDNLAFLSESGCKIDIRYPLVVGYNDGECEKIGALLHGMQGIREIKVLQYHNLSASRYESLGIPCTLPKAVTTRQDVERAVEILKNHGLNAVNGITDS